jgi:hypothetical protein
MNNLNSTREAWENDGIKIRSKIVHSQDLHTKN